jgi:membrane dipeptidase
MAETETRPLIVDAHEDLAYNMLNFGRDYRRSAVETRQAEAESGSEAPLRTGRALLGWPDYQRGRVAIVFGTLFAMPGRRKQGDWDKQAYDTFEQAGRLYRLQLQAYRELTDRAPDKFRLIGSRRDLDSVLAHWADASAEAHPVGILPLMEGGEGVRSPAELDEWWASGLRVIGPAWAGTRYCGGTNEPGPLTDDGRQLLEAMAGLGFSLDISHMDPISALQALDLYGGPVIASHANPSALVPGFVGNRLLPDEVIRAALARGAVIGLVPFCRFLRAGWKVGDRRDGITLEDVAAHVDHICQMAGDAHHAAIGTDFDGGFGLEAVPEDIDTIADLQKLGPVLAAKGYNSEAVAAVLGGNWLRHLQEHLPA